MYGFTIKIKMLVLAKVLSLPFLKESLFTKYRIRGTFGDDFNLADLAPTDKLKSPPTLLFYLKSYLILTMNELIR